MKLHLESTTSTMDEARALIAKQVASGTVIYADFQEKGRGRIEGRKWVAKPKESLLATFIYKTEDISFQLTSFPLFAGFVVANCLKKNYGIDCKVKWPNDVLVGEAKLCGIYTECIDNYISCGIGINLNQTEFDPDYHRKGCSIRTITGINTDRDSLLDQLLTEFDKNLKNADWLSEFQKILYKKGKKIAVMDGLADSGIRIDGILQGIGDYGQMLIKDETGSIKEIFAGEIL